MGSTPVLVNVIDDDQLEGPENFFGNLMATVSLPSNVNLAPNIATANIIDNDGEM